MREEEVHPSHGFVKSRLIAANQEFSGLTRNVNHPTFSGVVAEVES
jgi:hypothetical protein